MDPQLKVILYEIQKSKEDFNRRFDAHDEQWKGRFADLDHARADRAAAADKRFDALESTCSDLAIDIGKQVADLEALRGGTLLTDSSDRVTALEVATTDLSTWRPAIEALVDDLKLEVSVASMYLEGNAACWYESIDNTPAIATWTTFCQSLHDRFDRDQHEAFIRQLFQIKQTSTITDYVERFTKLVDQLKAYSATTDPLFYTMRFVDGLRPELKAIILVSKPKSLDAAISMALVQEEVATVPTSRASYQIDWITSNKSIPKTALPLPLPPQPDKQPAPTAATPTPATMSLDAKLAAVKTYRRGMGLCYKCGAKWSKDHKCNPQVQLHVVQELWDLLQDEDHTADTATPADSDPQFCSSHSSVFRHSLGPSSEYLARFWQFHLFHQSTGNLNGWSYLMRAALFFCKLLSDVASSYSDSPLAQEILSQLAVNPAALPQYSLSNGVIRYKGRIWLGHILYGFPARHFVLHPPTATPVADLNSWLDDRALMTSVIQQHLSRAQTCMKRQGDKHHSERSFAVGEWVFLKVQPYVQSSVARRANQKLAFRFFGPYHILERIGAAAYKLALPSSSSIHPVFHVSQLKLSHGKLPLLIFQMILPSFRCLSGYWIAAGLRVIHLWRTSLCSGPKCRRRWLPGRNWSNCSSVFQKLRPGVMPVQKEAGLLALQLQLQ
ncbi:unnamed protein product [Miscanthus lutarioriparius]|uniref:Retrotransposon gag domain-containing protein n=1 Tax=Miscanthus lutarioriparius TaxID=422564 RepID=A0A811QGB5_9POAL|nr:unnamed protein product [Miscanthus lutarioriparius]